MKHVTLLCGCVLLLLAGPLPADDTSDTARNWLYKMGQAISRLNYQGRFMYINEDRRESMEILHRFDQSGERQRLISLDGSAREVLRDNDQVRCVGNGVEVSQLTGHYSAGLLPLALINPDDSLLKHYSLKMLEPGRVAGRPAVVVAVAPDDNYRYGYRLWIDENSGLLLRSQLLDASGDTLEELIYTSIQLKQKIPDELLEPAKSASGYIWIEPEKPEPAAAPASNWHALWLPEGFSINNHVVRTLPGSEAPVEHRMYSDGLASFSVYIESRESGQSTDFLDGAERVGAMHAFGVQHGDHHVTVVGDVPLDTVTRVARQMKMVGQRP